MTTWIIGYLAGVAIMPLIIGIVNYSSDTIIVDEERNKEMNVALIIMWPLTLMGVVFLLVFYGLREFFGLLTRIGEKFAEIVEEIGSGD